MTAAHPRTHSTFHRLGSAECRCRLLRSSLTYDGTLASVLVVSSASAARPANRLRAPEVRR